MTGDDTFRAKYKRFQRQYERQKETYPIYTEHL